MTPEELKRDGAERSRRYREARERQLTENDRIRAVRMQEREKREAKVRRKPSKVTVKKIDENGELQRPPKQVQPSRFKAKAKKRDETASEQMARKSRGAYEQARQARQEAFRNRVAAG